MDGKRVAGRGPRALIAVAVMSLVVQAAPLAAVAEPLLGADGQTIPREPLLTPQELGKSSVDGLQYGNPTEGLSLVNPPAASSGGSAQLTYPLTMPQGRGISPDLQLNYDSSAGDGWTGVGWDLSVGDVSVDTRWGVPRFDPAHETESYTLSGDALIPNALDGTQPRVDADRQDFTRQVETQYDEITRHFVKPADRKQGDSAQSPANYYWTVRDKTGAVYWYGAYPDAGGPTANPRTDQYHKNANVANATANGIDRSAIVTDDNHNQVHWLLAARRDVGVNMIKYHYRTLRYGFDGSAWRRDDTCDSHQAMCAQHTYLSGIDYTAGSEASNEPEDSPYHVQFLLDSDVNPTAAVRPDSTLTATGGYLDLTTDRLARVNVFFQPPVNHADGTGRTWDPASPDTFKEADPAHPTAQLSVGYVLSYKTGPFEKSQLASITQVGRNGVVSGAPTHTFDYFNDVGASVDPATKQVTPSSSYNGFVAGTAGEQQWNPRNDNLNTTSVNANTGVLGSAVSNAGEGHFYIGFNFEEPEKEGSFGLVGKFGGSDSTNRSEFIDLNGDGLPDKLFAGGPTGIEYRRNQGGATNTSTTFSDPPTPVVGLSGLSHEHEFDFNIGFGAFFGVTAEFGLGATFSWADQYFTDVNGDGLPDFVSHGTVWFNHLSPTGVPTFTQNSSDTPVPIDQTSSALPGDTTDLDKMKADVAANNPLVDTVRRWVAPYSGKVSVLAPVTLSPPSGTTSKDGVRVAIQQNGQEIDSQTLTAPGAMAFPTAQTLTVNAGDRLYFRVGSRDDGGNDQVQWNPAITYTAIAGVADLTKLPVDENGLDRTAYSASADFTTAGRPGTWVNMPYGGNVNFAGTVKKTAVTSDDIQLVLARNGTVIPGSAITIPAAFVGDFPLSVPTFSVNAPTSTTDNSVSPPKTTTTFDHVAAYLGVNSQIDLTKVSWRPQLVYSTAFQFDGSGNPQPVATTDSNGQPSLIIDVPPEIDQYSFHASSDVQERYTPGSDKTYNAVVSVTEGPNAPSGTAWLTVKDAGGVRVAQSPLALPATGPLAGATTSAVLPINVAFKSNNSYWFDITIRDPQIGAAHPSGSVALREPGAQDGSNDVSVPSLVSWEGQSETFPLPYRGWGVAGYKGEGTLGNGNPVATSAIDESAFVIDHNNLPKKSDVHSPTGYDDAPPQATSDRSFAYIAKVGSAALTTDPAIPNVLAPLAAAVWEGPRADLAASADAMRSSRKGNDSNDFSPAGGGAAHAVDRTSVGGPQFAATVGFGPASLGFAIGPNYGTQDYVDMNGDGLPDVVTPGHIQYTMPRGRYETNTRSVDASHTSQDLTIGIETGLSSGLIQLGKKSQAHSTSAKGSKNSSSMPGAGVGTFGIGFSAQWTNPPGADSPSSPTATYADQINQAKSSKKGGSSLPDTSFAFADVNGDGLPDMISAKADGIHVRYNLGYGFTDASLRISGGGFSSNETYAGSLGGGFQMPDGSFSGGVSANWNYSFEKYLWRDVNGDGVPDRIFKGGLNDQPTVAFSNGFSLLPDVPFGPFETTSALASYAGPHSSFSSTNGIGGSIDVTIGIPCFLFCNIIIGVGGSFQQSNSSPQVDLQDVNGDGYPDSVKGASDGAMLVRVNQTGRSNLLSKVTNPMGGKIALDYARAGNTTDQPGSVWTMSKVDIDDGHVGDEPALPTDCGDSAVTCPFGNVTRKLFSYTGGHYDRLLRQSNGFATVVMNEVDPTDCKSTDPAASTCGVVLRSTTTTYLNDSPFDAGQVSDMVLSKPNGTANPDRLQETKSTWQFTDIRNGGPAVLAPPPNDPANVRTLNMSVSPLLARTETLTYTSTGQVGGHSQMDFAYDRLGNVIKQVDYGQLDNPDDDVVAAYTYSDCRHAESDGLNAFFGCGSGNADPTTDVQNPPPHPSPLYSPDECSTYTSLPITFDVTNGKTGAGLVTYRSREGATAICDNSSITVLHEKPGDGTVATTRLNYDQWGNYNRIVYPVGENGLSYAVHYTYDTNVGHSNIAIVDEFQLSDDDATTFLNDDYVGSKPEPKTEFPSSLGLSTVSTFDGLSGRIAATTDPNNLVTTYGYDNLNRIASVSSPRDPGSSLVTYSYNLSDAAQASGNVSAIAHNFDLFHPGDTIDTIAFVDGAGRVTQNKRDAALFTAAGQPATVAAVVSGHVDYDVLGRIAHEYNPTKGNGSFGAFDVTAPNGPVTTTSYDLLDRPTQSVEPGNRVTTTSYDFAKVNGSGPTLSRTTETDPAKRSTVTYNDVRGVEIAQVDAPNNAALYPPRATLFQSDGMGQSTQITDSGGNKTANTYDWMGRRTSNRTPDGGLVTFTYDAEGKMTSRLTPNERAANPPTPTTYHYDFGRLVKVAYPDASQNVTYTYGAQAAPNNGAGRVVKEEDGSRIQTLEYNPAGQVTKQVADMKLHNWPGPGNPKFMWTTQWDYDGFGRLASMTYPDSEKVTYGYDAGGSINSLGGDKTTLENVVVGTNPDGTPITAQQPVTRHYSYLNDRQYDVFGHRRFDSLGNGVTSEFTFDQNTQWLTRELSISKNRPQADAAHKTIQDLNYSYDAAGNPTTYANNLPAPVSSLMGGATTESYGYDGYSRLTSGSGTWQAAVGKTQHFTFSLQYDTQGNVVSKKQYDAVTVNGKDNPVAQTTYSFTRGYPSASGAPHQASGDSTGTYTYDADGNLTGIFALKKPFTAIRTLKWDANDNMTSINDNGGATTYAYDDTGERRIENGPSGETAFVNPWVTAINGGVMYKHIWAGDDRIATQKTLPTGVEPVYSIHKDLQGSTNVVTDATGQIFQHQEYFPTGEPWITENSTVFRTPYQYAGGYTDNSRDTINIGSRWYDQNREMFYSPDPALTDSSAIVAQPSISAAYSFAGSNPVANVDPSGNLWTVVNKKYALLQQQSRSQIHEMVDKGGPVAETLFRGSFGPVQAKFLDLYGKRSQRLWKRVSAASERASAPLFDFQFGKDDNGNIRLLRLDILGFNPRQKALAAARAAAASAAGAASAAPVAAAEPLTPLAQQFSDEVTHVQRRLKILALKRALLAKPATVPQRRESI